MSEQARRQIRVSKVLLARVRRNYMEFFCNVVDVAKEGLGLVCNRVIEPGDKVLLWLNVPNHRTMELSGIAAWKRELPKLSRNKFQIGVRLAEPPDEYTGYVEALIRKEFERRRHRRFADIFEISGDDVIDLLDAATQDVSAAGLYIRTARPLPVGGQYEIVLSAPGLGEPLRCLMEVVASFETDADNLEHPYGAGVKIISFAVGDADRFTDYLEHLEELYRFHWPEGVPEAPPEADVEIELD